MSWLNLPVSTSGTGPISNNQASPTDAGSYEFMTQFYDALEEKKSLSIPGCVAEFPPNSVYWAQGNIDGVEINDDEYGIPFSITFTITGLDSAVDPTGPCSGSRWAGYYCGPCFTNIPADYDLIVITNYNDAYTWIRLPIISNTYDSGTITTTITTDILPAQNAVVAKFISSISDFGGAQYRITKAHSYGAGAGLTSRDRRPLKPNQEEIWRGNITTGWMDESGNGVIQELLNSIDPSPYDTDGGSLPGVNWNTNKYLNKEIMYFDPTGLAWRDTISGNGQNQIGFGKSIYQVTITAISGTITFDFSGYSITLPYDSIASAIQTALSAKISGTTVSGSGPFVITFPAFSSLSVVGGTIEMPPTATSITGAYIIVPPNAKGLPGRIPDDLLQWYSGAKQPYITQSPSGGVGSVNKPVYDIVWSEGDVCSVVGCIDVEHTCFSDCQYELDNNCVGTSAGDWLAPNYWKCWRALQEAAIGLLGSFIDIWNTFGDQHSASAPNLFTPATWAVEANSNYGLSLPAYTSTLTVTGTGPYVNTVSLPSFTVNQYPLSVYWTIQDADQANIANGTASLYSDGTINTQLDATYNGLTMFLWAGPNIDMRARHKYCYPKGIWIPDCNPESGCQDPPAVTVGGEVDTPDAPTLSISPTGGTLNYNTTYAYRISALNATGETLASTEVSIVTDYFTIVGGVDTPITTNFYTVTLNWTPELGASSYNIYGRTPSGELLMANVSSYTPTWTDDGSITPSGSLPTSNTTSSSCFGTGLWNFRDKSSTLVSSTLDGFVNEGGISFTDGLLSRHVTDNWQDAFSGRGPIQHSLADQPYWQRFFRGHYHKSLNLSYTAHQSGTITYGTKYSIFDPTASWWNDGISYGILRVQGGQLTTGGTTTVADSGYNDTETNKACWFETARFVGTFNGVNSTPYSFFTMEIYSGGSPAGWTIAPDGTSTYTAPTASGHSGTYTSGAPTVSGTTPSLIHATGFTQPWFIQGDNFAPTATVTLTDPAGNIYTLIPTTVTAGELSMSFLFPRGVNGTWTFKVNNPSVSSSNQNLTVNLMQSIAIQSFLTGSFTFHGTLATAATTSDYYLIREPRYECSKWSGKVVTITPPSGSAYQLVCRYSDDTCLYFDQQSDVIVSTYSINTIGAGAVLQYSNEKPSVDSGLQWCESVGGNYWVQPSGSDARKSGVTFKTDIMMNCENKVQDYGLIKILSEYSLSIPNELYYMLISMKWTVNKAFTWTSRHDPATPEQNSAAAESGPAEFGDPPDAGGNYQWPSPWPDFAASIGAAQVDLAYFLMTPVTYYVSGPSDDIYWVLGGTSEDNTNTPPGKSISASYYWQQDPTVNSGAINGGLGVIQASMAYKYAKITTCPNSIFSCEVNFWNYADCYDYEPKVSPPTWTSYTQPPPFAYQSYADANVFLADSVPVLYRQWIQWDTESNDSDGNAISIKLGDMVAPTIPTLVFDPDLPPTSYQSGEGSFGNWRVKEWCAILKWSLVYV